MDNLLIKRTTLWEVEHVEDGSVGLYATRREAEARLAELRRSNPHYAESCNVGSYVWTREA